MTSRTRYALVTTGIAVIAALIPLRSQSPAPVEAYGLVVTPGPGWQLNREVLDGGGPISFTNFGGNYLRGGVLPPGGAEIDFVNQPLTGTEPFTSILAKDTAGAQVSPPREMAVAGALPGARVTFHDTYGQSLSYDNVAIYAPRGQTLYKFFLTYRTGDPNAAAFSAGFDQMVGSLRLK